MADKNAADWSGLVRNADNSISDLCRAIARVDRFNPMYFRALASILTLLSGLTVAFAARVDLGSKIDIVISLFSFFIGLMGIVAAILTLREALIYGRRWNRAKAGLIRSLRKAEYLAASGFVSTDKLDPIANDEIKNKLLLLRDAIRDAHERLGMKD